MAGEFALVSGTPRNALSNDVNQFARAFNGTVGYGKRLQLTDFSSSSEYILDIQSPDASVGPMVRARDDDDLDVLIVNKTGVSLGKAPSVLLTSGNGNFDVKYAGTTTARFWGSGGLTPGSLGLVGGLTIRDDAVADQTTSTMLLVQNMDSDIAGYALATFNHGITTGAASDGAGVSIIQDLTAGGTSSLAQGRGLNLEVARWPAAGGLKAVGDKCIEMGLHLGARLNSYMDSAGEWGYVNGAQSDSVLTKSGIFMINDSTDQFGAGVKVYRTGSALTICGDDGWDWFDVRLDENLIRVFELDHRGRTQFRPASFTKVWFFNGIVTYTDKTTAANVSAIGGTDTVSLPTGASNYVYVGSTQTFNSVYFDIAIANSYAAGVGDIVAEYWNGSAWAGVSVNQPSNGSVLTDNTRATSAGGQVGTFVQSGMVSFACPDNWTLAAPSPISSTDATARYWVRFGVQTTASTVNGTAHAIRPGRTDSFEVFAGSADTLPALAVTARGDLLVNGRLRVSDEIVHTAAKTQTKSANYTMTAADSGYITYIDTDAFTITLPATVVGYSYTFVNAGIDGAVLITIAPNAVDKIQGVGISAADNKTLLNTKATACHGDMVRLVADGTDGWIVQQMHGTWVRGA